MPLSSWAAHSSTGQRRSHLRAADLYPGMAGRSHAPGRSLLWQEDDKPTNPTPIPAAGEGARIGAGGSPGSASSSHGRLRRPSWLYRSTMLVRVGPGSGRSRSLLRSARESHPGDSTERDKTHLGLHSTEGCSRAQQRCSLGICSAEKPTFPPLPLIPFPEKGCFSKIHHVEACCK